MYTTGTWQWVYGLVWMMQAFANEKYSDFWYDLIVGSSMWAYISHYFFIVLSANYIVRPLNLSYLSATICNVVFTWVCIFITNAILNKLLASKAGEKTIKKVGLKINQNSKGSSKRKGETD